ncbi:hypothetical protein [Tropicimonas sp. IMCC6043]|uniref:hypothetical protein n=1 Tax=Tropicimonas sp. IMCC6043 TaxID=2510645 RepID=UPI00101C866F|nr:hypothetical protein [Tropicimonas sp. IMCC6043]RYH06489.1 hypothetical protein EU800_23645 [Tropicimonas sp. IMCC6043]
MTPSFALLLDNDGLTLLHDAGRGWRRVDTVLFETPDLAAALEAMRTRADALAGGAPIRAALVLPNSQILYAEADAGTDAADNARRAARRLDGATPYALEELVFDWKTRGGKILIAAVARETLEEAEDFALKHGFGPMSFTATPAESDFPGAPFFGPCDAAAHLLNPGEILERPARPILSLGDLEPPAEAATAAEPVAAEARDGTDTAPAVETPAEETPEAAGPSGAQALAPATTPLPAPETDLKKANSVSDPQVDIAEETPKEKAALQSDGTAEPLESPDEAGPTADALPAPSFASIRPRIQSEIETPPPPSRAPATPATGASTSAGQEPRAPSRKTTARPPRKDSRNRVEPVLSARSAAAAATPPKPVPATPPVADTATAPPPAAATKAKLTAAPAAPILPAVETSVQEAEALTVFGARKSQQDSRPPLRLEVLAAAAGVAAIAIVGLWSFVGGPSEDTATLSAPSDLVSVAPVLEDSAPAVTDLAPTAPVESGAPDAIALTEQDSASAPDMPASLPESPVAAESAAAPVTDAEGTQTSPVSETADALELAGAGTRSPTPGDALSATTPATPAAAEDPAGEVEDLTEPEIAGAAETVGVEPDPAEGEELALLTPTEEPTNPELPAAAPLDPVSARAAYAVSGIWQAPPEQGIEPKTEDIEDIYIASIDPSSPVQDAYSLPDPRELAETAPQAAEPPVVPAPTPDPEAAAPESGLTPGGVAIRLGPPDIVPPRRPDGLAPEQAETPAETADPDAEAAPEAEDPLREFRPRTRPDGLIEETERTNLGGRTRSELALFRPAKRPASVQETAEALAEAQSMADAQTEAGQQAELLGEDTAQSAADADALALDLATATDRAIAESPEPRLRPANIAQIADRARRRAELEAAAEQEAAEAAEAAQLEMARKRAAEARAAQERDAKEAEAKAVAAAAAAARAAQEAEAEAEEDAASSGPAVPRRERANPTGPISARVAREATVANAVSLRKVSLIGVYGTSSQRRALVRLPSGKMVKLKVGDRLDGGRVAAIGASDLSYQKSGRMVTLKMPKG